MFGLIKFQKRSPPKRTEESEEYLTCLLSKEKTEKMKRDYILVSFSGELRICQTKWGIIVFKQSQIRTNDAKMAHGKTQTVSIVKDHIITCLKLHSCNFPESQNLRLDQTHEFTFPIRACSKFCTNLMQQFPITIKLLQEINQKSFLTSLNARSPLEKWTKLIQVNAQSSSQTRLNIQIELTITWNEPIQLPKLRSMKRLRTSMLIDTSSLCCPSATVDPVSPLKEHGGDFAENGEFSWIEGTSGRWNGLRAHRDGGGLWDFVGEKVLLGGGDMEERAVAIRRNWEVKYLISYNASRWL